jgi:4-amino-4-deoxy-L-arabinose transferase-like glycosyltransferase
VLSLAVLAAWCVGLFGRGYWTPDEPREADIAWRMSWQSEKAVPLLAGEPFCEKPPLTYWVAGAAMRALGTGAWAARLPNLLYALITALCVGLLARRSAGKLAGFTAAAAMATFLLSYQVAIWLATDAPLLAAVAVALLGAYRGLYAAGSAERLRGYTLMHAALAAGFLCKSAAAWMVPFLTIVTLVIWERRWRELLRWELYPGLALQALVILAWVGFVYTGADGYEHLKVFFWNNLAGRFVHIEAPQELQYASGHKNIPGKYLLELPMYLWPWTLLVIAALRRAWIKRHAPFDELRPVRFALASTLPAIALLSLAATARNIYLAPALPGFALLIGWWGREIAVGHDRWDLRSLRVTAMLMLGAVLVFAAAVAIVAIDAWGETPGEDAAGGFGPIRFIFISACGLLAGAVLCVLAQGAARRGEVLRPQVALLLAYCALLTAPASQLYGQVDAWQNLPAIGRAIATDARGRPLILMTPDETTRAFIDMYVRTKVDLIDGPIDAAAISRLQRLTAALPDAYVVAQLPGREVSASLRRIAARVGIVLDGKPMSLDSAPPWAAAARLRNVNLYSLPNGRRYALLEAAEHLHVPRHLAAP